MLKANAVKKLAICSLVSTVAMGSSAMAHTTIQSTITANSSGVTSSNYNNIIIGHTCSVTTGEGDNAVTKKFPIKAQSVLFPTVSPDILVDSGTSPSGLAVTDLITSATGLANIPQLVKSRDIFNKQSEKYQLDSDGKLTTNVIGFNSYSGDLSSELHGLVPFRFNSITFKTGISGLTDGCVKKLVIKVAIADVCKMVFPNGGPKEGQANTWIPNPTDKFSHRLDGSVPDPDTGSTDPRIGSPASLTIDNSAACATGSTVTIWPSNADIDANLVIPKVWGK